MRECCLVPMSVCKCLRAPANPSFTMPVLKLLSDSGSVRTQVSFCYVCVCVSAVCLLSKALLHFENCSLLQLFAKETPIDFSCCSPAWCQTRMFGEIFFRVVCAASETVLHFTATMLTSNPKQEIKLLAALYFSSMTATVAVAETVLCG